MKKPKKAIRLDFVDAAKPQDGDDTPFLQSLQRYADSWISGTGVLPPYKINSILVYLYTENKHIRDVEMDVVREKKHIQYRVKCGVMTLLSGRRRNKIVESIESIMGDFATGWTFNVLFERGKSGKKA